MDPKLPRALQAIAYEEAAQAVGAAGPRGQPLHSLEVGAARCGAALRDALRHLQDGWVHGLRAHV